MRNKSPYTEDDAPHPINAYGRSKLAGETALRQAGGDYVLLRASWIYAARGRNFVHTILRLANERDDLRIVDDQIGAPTWARDIAEATARIVRAARDEQAAGDFAPGILNLSAAGATSWHGFAGAILDDAMRAGLLNACRGSRRSQAKTIRRRRPGRRIPVLQASACASGSD